MSKKKKITIITVSSILAALLIAGVILLIVFLGKEKSQYLITTLDRCNHIILFIYKNGLAVIPGSQHLATMRTNRLMPFPFVPTLKASRVSLGSYSMAGVKCEGMISLCISDRPQALRQFPHFFLLF